VYYVIFHVSELRPAMGQRASRWHMGMKSHGGIILTGENEELWEKPVPESLCSPQIPHGLTRAWIRASTMRGLCHGTALCSVLKDIYYSLYFSEPKFILVRFESHLITENSFCNNLNMKNHRFQFLIMLCLGPPKQTSTCRAKHVLSNAKLTGL
jgi:hypothetical protein